MGGFATCPEGASYIHGICVTSLDTDSDPAEFCTGTTGVNGLGKLISVCTTNGSAIFVIGCATAEGYDAVCEGVVA